MNKSVLMILVDGLRHDYMNPDDSPFLQSIAELNIDGTVRETFAFELRPAFFAGVHPEQCDIANKYCYSPKDSPFRSIDVSHGDRKRITMELRAEARLRGYSLVQKVGDPAEIPLNLLKYFSFSERYHTARPSAVGQHKTVFDYLRSDDKKWLWIGYPDGPGTTDGVIRQFNEKFAPDVDFVYLHFSALDWVGHQYGPHSDEQRKCLYEIDEAVRQVYVKMNRAFSEVRGVIFGDHGQVKIKKNIDIESMLRETGLVVEKDYVYFLDSTQARFWFFNQRARKAVEQLLFSIPDGRVLTESDYSRLRFRFKHNEFGELIFVVNDGVGIFPNFFQRLAPYKGLHGYLPEVEDNWARIILTGCCSKQKIDQPVSMVSIFPTLLEVLGYERPNDIEVASVFEKEGIGMETDIFSVSVVLPTYNRANILRKCLLAIERQSFSKELFELIVVNDGSTDSTQELLEEYEEKTELNFRYFSQENSGPAAARNRGVMTSRGSIIILIGDDMIMAPNVIEKHVQFHREWPQLSHACLGYIDWSRDIEVNTLMTYITSEGGQQFSWDGVFAQDRDNIGYRSFWSSNISFKRRFSLTHGLFNDEVFKHAMWEDVELGHRLDKAGLVMHFRQDCVVYHEHEMTFEEFANRQRMVGWYSCDMSKLGIDMRYECDEHEGEQVYSKKALRDIVNAVMEFEDNCSEEDIQILKKVYDCALYYAALVGCSEREGTLKEDVGGIVVLLNDLWFANEKMKNANEEMKNIGISLAEAKRKLDERNRQVAAKDLRIQSMMNSWSWKLTAPLRSLYNILRRRKS